MASMLHPGSVRAVLSPVPLPRWLFVLFCSASSFAEALRMGAEVYHNLKNLIKDKYGECTQH